MRLVCGIFALCYLLTPALPSDIPPPTTAHAQCLMLGAIGVQWPTVEGADGYVLWRSEDGAAWERLVQTAETEHVDRESLAPEQVYFYAVSAVVGGEEQPRQSLGIAANSANLVAGGDFEIDPPGSERPLCFDAMSGAHGRLEVVPGSRPGGTGRQMLQVTGDITAPIIRLHTPNYRVVPGGVYIVRAWMKDGPQGVSGLGGRILTAEGEKCKSMVVNYFQSAVIAEGEDGWRHLQGWSRAVPEDAATLQLWALGWRTQGPAWKDDLEVIDDRIVRLATFDIPALTDEVRTLLETVPTEEEMGREAEEALQRVNAADLRANDPQAGVTEVLEASAELLQALNELDMVRWDLKIMGLKHPVGGGH